MPTRTDLVVRLATPADWPSMWPIWRAVVAAGDTYTYDPGTPEHAARAMWLDAPAVRTWVAHAGTQLLGFYKITPNQHGPGAHVANGSYMVAASARGTGVGRALVEHSLEAARSAGFLAMQFNAVVATNVHAIRLYHQLGFATVGVIPGAFRHPGAGLVDLVVMHRDLRQDAPEIHSA